MYTHILNSIYCHVPIDIQWGKEHILCTLLCGFLNLSCQFAMTQMNEECLPENTVTGSFISEYSGRVEKINVREGTKTGLYPSE